MVVKAQGTDYGLGLEMKTTKEKSMKAGRAPVPLELEDMPLPLNTFKNKSPFTGTIKSVERIVGPNATGETCHIIIEHGGKMPFWEGQSYGVIPPGTKVNSKGKEVPHGVRLYSHRVHPLWRRVRRQDRDPLRPPCHLLVPRVEG